MTLLAELKDLIQKTTRALCYAGMFLLIPMMLLTSTEVVARAGWDQPVPGSLELSSYLLAVFVLLGLAYTHQVKGHVRVEMLLSRLPRRARLSLDLFTTFLSLIVIALLAWQGLVFGLQEKAVSDMLRVPQWPFKTLVAVGAFFLFLEFMIDLLETIGKLRKG